MDLYDRVRETFVDSLFIKSIPENFDEYENNSKYKTNLSTWDAYTKALDNLALTLYHPDDFSKSEYKEGQKLLGATLTSLMAEIIVPYPDHRFPWLTNWYEWYVKLPQALVHTIFLPLPYYFLAASVVTQIIAYLNYVTSVTSDNGMLPGPKKGPIISSGPNAIYTFFNWYETQVYLNPKGPIDLSSLDMNLVSDSFYPKIMKYFDDENDEKLILSSFQSPLQKKIDANKSLNGYYEDGSILFHKRLFTIAYSMTIFQYLPMYSILDIGSPNLSFYEYSFAKIFHPEMGIGPSFCTQLAPNLYNNILPKYFPSLLNNYGISIMPLTGSIYIKTKNSYFCLRVQNKYLAAFEADEAELNQYQWPMWTLSRRIYTKDVTYPNISNEFEIATTPGIISDFNDKITPVVSSSTTQLFFVYDTDSFVCQMRFNRDPKTFMYFFDHRLDIPPNEPLPNSTYSPIETNYNMVVWLNKYTLRDQFYNVKKGINMLEFGAAFTQHNGSIHVCIHYLIFNRLTKSKVFYLKDLYNSRIQCEIYDFSGILLTDDYIVLQKEAITSFTMYQRDLQDVPTTNSPKTTIPSRGKSLSSLASMWIDGAGGVVPRIYLEREAISATESKYVLKFQKCRFEFSRIQDYIYHVNYNGGQMGQVNFLVTNFPHKSHQIQHQSAIYQRSSDYNYYRLDDQSSVIEPPPNDDNISGNNGVSGINDYFFIWSSIAMIIICLVISIFLIGTTTAAKTSTSAKQQCRRKIVIK